MSLIAGWIPLKTQQTPKLPTIPAQTTSSGSTRKNDSWLKSRWEKFSRSVSQGLEHRWVWVGFVALAVVLGWFGMSLEGGPGSTVGPSSGGAPFAWLSVLQGQLPKEEARTQYRQALTALKENRFQEAADGFEALQGRYGKLEAFVLLHGAEANAELPREDRVQKKLKLLLRKYRTSPLAPLTQYRLAQSYLRSGNPVEADKLFYKLVQDHPKSPYALGSLYYLGQLAMQVTPAEPEKARRYWHAYLDQSPDGRFGLEIAHTLEGASTTSTPLTPEEHRLVGLTQVAQKTDWKHAVQHLRAAQAAKLSMTDLWIPLGQALLETGNIPLGVEALKQGLKSAPDLETARTTLDLVLKHTPPKNQKPLLLGLSSWNLPVGGDYVLWKLALLEPSTAHYQAILQRYPTGDYAPESAWQLVWPSLKNGQCGAFLSQSAEHPAQYPHARSAPRVAFWQGKCLEKTGRTQEALAKYQQVLSRYPGDYYAFRAAGRRAALQGQGDPGWKTEPGRGDYSAAGGGQAPAFPTLERLPNPRVRAMAQELWAIEAGDDLALLLQETLGQVPADIESWHLATTGQPSQSIRVMRDDLMTRSKKGGKPTPTELRLLYPRYHESEIAPQAANNRLDPFLVQALMREESYFNETAVSSSNAMGLMQLLPSTAAEVAHWVGLSDFKPLDLFRPEVNIRLGSRYLGHLHQLFGGDSMRSVGAYNGGPNAMKRWASEHAAVLASDPDLFVELIPYEQSRDYIKKVFASYWNYQKLYGNG